MCDQREGESLSESKECPEQLAGGIACDERSQASPAE